MPQPLQERTWLVDLEYCRERTGWTKNQFPPLSISKWSLWSHKSAQFHGTDDDEYYQEKNKKKKKGLLWWPHFPSRAQPLTPTS